MSTHVSEVRYSGETAVRIADAVTAVHKRYVGSGPQRVRTSLSADLVACLLEGGFTSAEKTLVGAGKVALVTESRSGLWGAMDATLTEVVQRILGRRVVSLLAAVDPAHDPQTAVFVLEQR